MRIGDIAHRAGISVETVRFYERRGLIRQPRRPERGFRSYPAETVVVVRFIRQAQNLGFSLAEIGDLLSLRGDPEGDCGDVRQRAESKLAEVDAKLARLHRLREVLTRLIDSCPAHGALCTCSIFSALEEGTVPEEEIEP